MNYVFILDGVITFLLVATIIYCWKLSRKISTLHEGRHELNHFIADFNTAITRAETNINHLKDLSGEAEEKLGERIEKARHLANDLSFLTDRGENVADSLESFISGSRPLTKEPERIAKKSTSPTPNFSPSPVATKTNEDAVKAKRSGVALLAKAIKEKGDAYNKNISAPVQMTPSKKQVLDNALAQIAAHKNRLHTTNKTEKFVPPTISAGTVKTTSAAENSFNERRLSESLKANQQVKQ